MFLKLFTTLRPSLGQAIGYLKQRPRAALGIGGSLFLGIIPLCLLVLFINYGIDRWQKINQEITRLEYKTKAFVLETKKRKRFKKEFGLRDAHYLQNYVEPIALMSQDIGILTQVKNNSSYTNYRPIQERLDALTEDENQIRFVNEKRRSSEYYDESEWRMERPVLVNYADLKQILVLLEGIKISQYLPNPLRPQIFIKKFDLEITNLEGVHKEFTLDMEVIQRGCHETDHS